MVGLPGHTTEGLAVAVTVGPLFTVTVALDVAVQPLPSVPVTV